MKIAHPGMEISKPGYLKQRMELNPLAFYELCRHHNRNFYVDIYLDKRRIRHYQGTDIGQRMEELGYITLRENIQIRIKELIDQKSYKT